MEIRTFTGRGFGENAYLVSCLATRRCVAVDPGDGAPHLVAAVQASGFELQAILLTHAHLDHVEGVNAVRQLAPDAAIWLHPDDLPLYRALDRQAAMFGLSSEPQPEPTDAFIPGTPYAVGEVEFDVRFTPGHAPGHVILVHRDSGQALVGDVVFQGSIGRTDLPGGDFKTLMRSIRDEVLVLPDDTVLYPGHGPATTVGDERRFNPFLRPPYMEETP